MQTLSDQSLLESLSWRYATKHFDPSKKISEADWNTLAEVLRLAPSSYGLQPWKFMVVHNAGMRKALREVSWAQPQIEECSHLVVLATLKTVTEEDVRKFITYAAKVRGVSEDALGQYRDMMMGDVVFGPRSQIANYWTQRQAYIAMGFLLEAAAFKGIDACPMEGFDPVAYDQILGLNSTNYASVAVVALGYRSVNDAYQHYAKVRYPLEEVVQVIP